MLESFTQVSSSTMTKVFFFFYFLIRLNVFNTLVKVLLISL